MKKIIPILLSFFLFCGTLQAQMTTASINGLVTDEKGEALPGATITATHVPSGTKYGVTTRVDGRFTLPNVRVGGPYTLEVTFVGFKAEKAENIVLSLGQKLIHDFKMVSESAALSEIVVKANPILNGTRTGSATSIGNEQLQSLPTISRSQEDFTRLDPMAASGGSFAGRNSRYNNYSLDGAIFNNPFGLDASTPGGQTDAQPISLDAIEQVNVSKAPYDVTQAGFTGASIDAVTKSGTNKLSGTVFGFYRDQNLVGKNVKGLELPKADLSQKQFGFSLGGALIKDKLFFFVNAEFDRRSDLGSTWIASDAGRTGANVSRVLKSDLDMISNLLKTKYGYDTGPYENYLLATENQKFIAKLDWNISQNHKLTFTYNNLDAFKEKPAHPSAIGRRGPDFTTLQFRNAGYRINNKLSSGIVELKSQFGNKYSNKLQVGYSEFNDSRDPFSTPFPVVNLDKDGVRYIVAGHEPFSIHNVLAQRVYQINDNFNIYAGQHTITLGGAFEKFSFDNSFNLGAYAGTFADYGTVQDFVKLVNSGGFDKDVQAAKDTYNTNNAKGTWALAQTNVGQLAFYAQDEWALNSKFNLTYGIRVDAPMYFDTKSKIEESIARNCCYDPTIQYYDAGGSPVKLDSKQLPEATPLISPRVGFNYDVKGDRSEQLRGGTGLFTGRFPFVWIGNQVANPNFYFYCTTAPDFKFPQVWRTNLGYDKQLSNGWIASLDVMYTKDVNAMIVRNYGLKLPSAKLQGIDNRPVYAASDRSTIFGGATNAYVFSNTNLGYSFNSSIQLEKSWKDGMYVKFGYNFADAQDASSLEAEISSDAYDRNPANIQHTNTPVLSPSVFGNKHRFIGTIMKKITYGDGKFATNFSLFAEYVKGGRYSFTYSGDVNNDGSGSNDLIFIPTDAQIDQTKFSGTAAEQATQKAAFKSYIAQDDYLNGRRGQYAEKYASLLPWYSNWDVRVAQDFNFKNKNKVQFSIDILNVGNLLNSSWGVRQIASVTNLVQPISVAVDDKGVPTYTFDTSQKTTYQNDYSLLSRWRMQFGLRYSF